MSRKRILIAGVGNVFKGDDAFGVEVVRALLEVNLPDDVAVADFGIRGIDLAFAMSEYEVVILIDAIQRGREPGTVSVIQPDDCQPSGGMPAIQGHNFDPWSVLSATRTLAASGSLRAMPDVYLVGCEPAEIPEEDELVEGLSPPVRAAVDEAVALIQQLIVESRSGLSVIVST
jgi:hydrogenase maturation protease